MAIRKVARMGHPVLRQVAKKIDPKEIGSEAVKRLIADMTETMHEYGGIGIAAPQVHESVQLALIDVPEMGGRYEQEAGQAFTVFINPEIKVLDETLQGFWEGCLSVPELRGLVFRPRKVEVSYLNEKGEKKTMVGEDFIATVLQHELDHLQGVLFVDKIQDMKQLAFMEEYQRYVVGTQDATVGHLDD